MMDFYVSIVYWNMKVQNVDGMFYKHNLFSKTVYAEKQDKL